ncbi:SBBP repeat-containing protein [Solirubrobacter ginsenosidimutans]|uniref:SBBP repeat-containing protein n=1 Tax=Solirubrobacter ginsenosidimutans TaxID=490573 RepID=A0A9X3MZ56_9ACTN|nr:SBBP repeat-containing protein [Solirubrobacter ginsenosidimutans]MDA0165207.1 SBBP repeat-containing protein [Solirubrobacter ginsenosidimutans]
MLRNVLSVAFGFALATFAVACGASPPPQLEQSAVAKPTRSLPLTFLENRGQTDPRVRFHVQGSSHAFFLTPDEIALTLRKQSGAGVNLALRFVGANPNPALTGDERVKAAANFIRGGRQQHVPGYQQVVYRDLWPGIDMALRGSDGELKYEFRVHPGADPRAIRLAYRGASGLTQTTDGALRIDTPLGALTDSPPVAYQDSGRVDSRYALTGRDGYGFAIGSYDSTRELIIDPNLAYSTFLGGASDDTPLGITTDAAGNAYVTGFTQSPDFPTTAGAFDRTGSASNNLDVFVTKLNPAGTAAVYSTFIGGGNFDWGRAITVDSSGNAYVTGQTKGSNFPTTGGAFDRTFNVDTCPRCGIDQYDAFLLKLNPTGSGLVYSTFLGGTQLDDALGIAIDGARNAYVAGQTVSSNFPTTAGAFDRTPAGGYDAFVTKLNATGSALVYSTLLGGEDNELPAGIKVDSGGNAIVGGGTRSTGFPTTPGVFDTTQNGGAFDERFDGFVTKLNAAGNGLVYSTFVGGSKSDFTSDFSVDAAGNTYVAGSTLSPDFPVTPGAFDSTFNGSESFALKLDPAGSRLVYSTFVPTAAAVAPDANGNAWLAGGQGPGALITPDAFAPFFKGGGSDAYVARLNATGSAIDFASFLGGSNNEGAIDLALDPAGDIYLAGHTFSSDFPTTTGAFDRTFAGNLDIFWGEGFVAKVDVDATAPPVTPPAPAPAAPALATPADAATTANPVTFDWGEVSGAASYTIQVDEISAFGNPLVASASVTASQWTTGALPEGTWFWRVRAVNSEGTPGAWSETRRITIQNAPPPPPPPVPGAPSLTSPAGGASVTQPFTFDWSDVANAAWYTIEVDDSASFSQPLVWAATTTPSQLATNSLPNGTLFWRVRAFNSDGIGGDYSAVRTVVVGPAPPGPLAAPSLLSPAADARFSPGSSITFDWSDVSGANGYTIQIDDSDSFSAPLTLQQIVSTSQFATSSLPTRRLWWRVRANDGGAWSAVRRFELKN